LRPNARSPLSLPGFLLTSDPSLTHTRSKPCRPARVEAHLGPYPGRGQCPWRTRPGRRRRWFPWCARQGDIASHPLLRPCAHPVP
jgi:hypothetical protein